MCRVVSGPGLAWAGGLLVAAAGLSAVSRSLLGSTLGLLLAAVLLSILAAPSSAAGEAARADFYVAPTGRDTWSGKLASPNGARTDGPFATVGRAQEAVRALRRAEPDRATPVVVMLRGGTYDLPATLTFTPADSGTAQSPTVYAAYPGEKPVLSGGTRITGWKKDAKGWWEAKLPAVQRGDWDFCQLWVDGHRRYRPRLPEDGYHFIAAAVPSTPANKGKGFDRFVFKGDDIRADWHDLADVDVLVFQLWTMSRLRIASVDAATHTVTFTGPTISTNYYSDLAKGRRFIVENVREALGRPGQFYLDRKSGVLTYIPEPGEDPAKSVVVAPRLDQLVVMKGDGAVGQWVEHIAFRGLTFAYSNWVEGPKGYCCGQAEVVLPGALSATGARDCALEGCAVHGVGTYAIEWGQGCKSCRVENCDLYDLGAGGVKIGTTFIPRDPNAIADHNVVRDCTIAHGGRLHPAGIGVWIGQSPDNVIEHNDIFDFYYSGMSIGWTWGYGPCIAQRNLVEYNHIHDLGQKVLSDMGGIYTLGNEEGTKLLHNLIHNVDYYYYGGWGIYFDEGTTHILAEDNIVYHTDGGCFHQHYGLENVLRNNIFAFDATQQLVRTRAENHLSFTFDHNIVYWKRGVLMGGNWSWTGHNYALDYNDYWNARKEPFNFAGLTLEQWRTQRGQDLHSVIADPEFVDPDHYDFRLKPDSPALKLGFKPIDLSTVGPRTKCPLGPVPLEVPRAYPGPPPPQPIADDFETTPVGAKPELAEVHADDDVHVIRVTDETAASGKHSLKFVDGPAVDGRDYNPHMFYRPGFSSGMVEDDFSIRLEPGAFAYHEWRSYPPNEQFVVGPSLWFQPDGWLVANGKKLFQVPYSKWMRFRIVCGCGEQNTGKYDLWVWLPGKKEPQEFADLPCDPRFTSLDWYGFTANGNKEAVFYVDDISVKPLASK